MKLSIDGKYVQAERGTRLSAYLSIDKPCGGKAKCGKCKVCAKGNLSVMTERERSFLTEEEIKNGIRLACMTEALGDAEIFTIEKGDERIATNGVEARYVLKPTIKRYGLAVDIGTTTLVVGLYSAKGDLLGKTGALNPQIQFGADVISRIELSLNGQSEELQRVIVEEIERLSVILCEKAGIDVKEIDGAVVTGNTAMLYLFTKTPVDGLARMPFSLSRPFGETITAKDLCENGFLPNMKIYLPPCISPFIGGDTICALLATSFWEREDRFMMVDIGTNGETVFYDKGDMYACSTAAGPAFEGVGISCGMRGEDGAIEHINNENGLPRLQVIGGKKAKGICGSGVIDAVAYLLETGQLDETGYMEEDVTLSDGVVFTCKDVRSVQLAKSAIYAGLTTLLKTVGVGLDEINTFMIAGGFGGYMDINNAGKIRLIPKTWVPCTRLLGNAAYNGAVALLLDEDMRKRCTEIVNRVKVIDLSASNIFMEEYMEGMTF